MPKKGLMQRHEGEWLRFLASKDDIAIMQRRAVGLAEARPR